MDRPSWDETWMAMADVIALRSRCDGRRIGAVVVGIDERIVSTGYNGPPARWERASGGTCSAWCPRAAGDRTGTYENCVSIHAEANALLYADRSRYQDGTIYVTSACCWDCGKKVANSGIRRVVMRVGPEDAHREPYKTILLMQESGLLVEVVQ